MRAIAPSIPAWPRTAEWHRLLDSRRLGALALQAVKGSLPRFPRIASAGAAAFLQRGSKPVSSAIAKVDPFRTDLEEMIEEQPPRFIRAANYYLLGLCVLLITAAAVVKVDVVVQGSGQLGIDVAPIVLQPMERSIVRGLNVKVGEAVRKGEVLATLDPTFVQADVASLAARQRLLQAQLLRLEAEWDGQNYEPTSLTEQEEVLQAAIFRQRQMQFASRVRAYDEEIQRYEAGIRSLDSQRAVLTRQLAIAQDIENMRSTLLQSQSGSKLQLLESYSVRLRAERDQNEAADRLKEMQHMMQAKRAERQAFIDQWRGAVLEEIDRVRSEASRTKEALAKAERMHDLVAVIAPEDGVVLDMARRSVGSVLREAEPLMTLMPSSAKLIAEVLVSSSDVGYPKAGDEVVVKVDAFPYQRHGTLKGRLLSIGEESFSSNGAASDAGMGAGPRVAGAAYHRARIELTDTRLDNLPRGARLIAGMTLSGEIKVGTRSVLSYFLEPITRGLDESIREP
jgi:HlyD family secretion protein